ncbi:hypothetical protein TEK04_12975 [Klenkia sp. LSe6-5]|uniref:Uncharacterized protein n=1 Tax=Klenkia sesuvii TaxID=3103137 RepID=A0ABU8DUY1_9ACTN
MELHEVGALLDPAPLPLETGWERLPSVQFPDPSGCSDVEAYVAAARRSHSCVGPDLPDLGLSPEQDAAEAPDLPALFVAEHRDTRPPRNPW